MRYAISILATLLFLGSVGYASAAPLFTNQRSILPETDGTYYLGSTSPDRQWAGVHTDEVCLNGSCRTSWPSGGGGAGAISTSTALVAGRAVYATGIDTIGVDAAFLWDAALDKLTVTNASTTNLSIGALSGILKQVGGVVSAATAGTDYENPLTFTYPITRAVNAVSLAFGTTTSNTWANTQTFTNVPVITALTGGLVSSHGTTDALFNTATSAVTCTTGISCTGFISAGPGGSTITATLGTSVDLASAEVTGTLPVGNGGTGSTTLTGILKGAGTSQVGTAIGNTDYQLPISLTTTGSSGAATFNGTTLNIPQYAGTTYTATYPVTLTGSAFGLAFGTTSSNTWAGTQTFTNTPVLGSLSGLVSANSGALYASATTTVTCSGTVSCSTFVIPGSTPITLTGSGVGGTGLATTSPVAAGNVLTYNASGAGSAYGTATTSLAVSGPFSVTGTLGALIGGSNSTINWTGLATTTQPSSSNLLVSNGGAGLYPVATSSVTISSPLTSAGTPGFVVGGSGWTLDVATTTNSLFTGTQGQVLGYTANGWTGVATTTFSGGLTYSAGNVTADLGTSIAPSELVGTPGANLILYTNSAGTGFAGAATSSLGIAISDTSGTLTIARGGTGTTTAPSGQLLYGGGAGVYQSVATTTVTCAGTVSCSTFTTLGSSPITITGSGGGGTGLATSSPVSAGNILAYTAAGAGSAYGVSTTTLAGTGVITISNAPSVIGATPAVASLTGGANGQVLGWSAGVPTWLATTTFSGGLTYLAGNVTADLGTSITVGELASADFGSWTCNGAACTIDASAVSNAMLANSTISGIALGSNLADLTATNGTLTFSGSYNGGTARTVGLNLGNANLWTGLQQFANASSTLFSATYAQIGGTATTTFGADGKITGNDLANGWSAQITPTRSFGLSTGTTSTWTASTTGSAYSPSIVMPFTGTLRQVRCAADASFLGVNVKVNGSSATPSYFVASSTVGKVGFTGGNTFTAGQTISADIGTTTTASTKTITCTFDATET